MSKYKGPVESYSLRCGTLKKADKKLQKFAVLFSRKWFGATDRLRPNTVLANPFRLCLPNCLSQTVINKQFPEIGGSDRQYVRELSGIYTRKDLVCILYVFPTPPTKI